MDPEAHDVHTRLFLEQLPVALWSIDADEIITSSLGAGLKDMGLEPGQLVGTRLTDYLGSDDPELLPLAMHRRALAGESGSWVVEWQGRMYRSFIEPLRDTDGRPNGAIAIAHDVTEIEHAQAELAASEERFRELAGRIEEVFWVRDPAQGEALYVSPAFRTIWGRDPSVCFEDGGYLETVHEEDREHVRRSFRAQREGRTTELEYRILRPDGSVRRILDRAYPVLDADGTVVRVCGVGVDVTRHREIEQELQRLQRLETAGQVAGQIAHDFNNLLAPLAGYPALLRKWSSDPDFQRLCDELERSALRIAEINQQLLTLGRRGHYRRGPVELGAVLRDTLAHVDVPAGVDVHLDLASDLPAVRGGAAQLERAFGNLVRNALEAMPDGGSLHVAATRVRTDDDEERVRVTIADTGAGIPAEARDQIFDPFFSTKEMDRERGSGLGLSVVHGVVEDHEGTVTVEGRPGEGARFHVDLPVAPPDAPPDADDPPRPDERSRRRALVVDDDAPLRRVVSSLLESLGYAVDGASSGAEAIAAATPGRYDVVFVDMVMEGLDGAETTRRLHAVDPQVRIVLLSGFAVSDRVQTALREGASGFLPKPVTLDALQRLLAPVASSSLER